MSSMEVVTFELNFEKQGGAHVKKEVGAEEMAFGRRNSTCPSTEVPV